MLRDGSRQRTLRHTSSIQWHSLSNPIVVVVRTVTFLFFLALVLCFLVLVTPLMPAERSLPTSERRSLGARCTLISSNDCYKPMASRLRARTTSSLRNKSASSSSTVPPAPVCGAPTALMLKKSSSTTDCFFTVSDSCDNSHSTDALPASASCDGALLKVISSA